MEDKLKEAINCFNCTHFSQFIRPRKYDETAFVHGYCFKNISGYAVYLPNGCCKKHSTKSEKEKIDE